MKRLFTFMLALVSIFTLAGSLIEVNAKQVSSDKENVYFNEYGQSMGRSINFDDNWRFYFGDAQGAGEKVYDDSKWRNINLPHDYSIEQEFSNQNGNEGESGYLGGGVGWYRKSFRLDDSFFKGNVRARIDFDGVYMDSTVYVNGNLLGNHPYGYTPFSYDITPYLDRGDNTIAVRVNHETPSSRWYSGSGIYRSVNLTLVNDLHVDLFGSKIQTPKLSNETLGEVEVIAETEVRNASRSSKAVSIKYEIVERLKDGSEGKTLKSYLRPEVATIEANTTAKLQSTFTVANPRLWSVAEPNLYYVKTTILDGDNVSDTYKEQYGFRFFNFDNNLGFSLNGERMKLQGVSMHHDQGSLGAVANKDAQERQIRMLKEMGANAIRVTHNPASQTLIDAANEMGILLFEEAFDGWDMLKNSNSKDYSRFFNKPIEENNKIYGKEGTTVWHEFDLKMQIKRGINSPAIIAWSLGNEIWEGTSGRQSDWPAMHREMISFVQSFDSSRPITTGDNRLKRNESASIAIGDQNTASGGIVGFNYASGANFDNYHNSKPEWPMYGAETSSAVNSRGVYYEKHKNVNNPKFELTSYDESAVGWGLKSSESWHIIQKRDYVAGEFIWTGFDYIGEPTEWNDPYGTLNRWPAPKNSYFGIIDTAGLPKDRYYFYQSQWRKDITTLHMLPTWNKEELRVEDGENVRVDVYSNAPEVRLYLDSGNGKQLLETSKMREFKSNATVNGNGNGYYSYMARNNGENHTDLYHSFQVPYAAGTISVEAYDAKGHLIEATSGIKEHTTAGRATAIRATVEKPYESISASNDSLAYIRLDVVDAKGNIVPGANNLIKTSVSGSGRFISMDNGHQADLTKFSSPERRVYHGSGIAIVGATTAAGEIVAEFSSPGLASAKVRIKTNTANEGEISNAPIGLSVERNYFVRVGNKPTLPSMVDVIYGNGRTEAKEVVWKNFDSISFDAPGIHRVNGVVDGVHNVTININVIDKIGGVYSYTAPTMMGQVPNLPERLEAFDDKGESLGLFLDMKWEMPGVGAFEHLGEIKIKGTSEFLGQRVETYASISIRETNKSYANIAPDAMNKTQDFNNNDSFDAMFNKNRTPNSGYWTNFDRSTQLGDKDSIIKLEYATQAQVARAAITFFKDSYSVVYPQIGDLVIEYLPNGESEGAQWQQITYTAQEGTESTQNGKGYVTYTYEFNKPVGITLIRFTVKNHPTNHTGSFNMAVTGITELELFGLTESMVVGREAKLDALSINGHELTEAELNKGYYNVSYGSADIKASGKDNAAVTIMPIKDDRVIIKILSEDKKKEGEFVVSFNKQASINPSYAGADYNSYTSIVAPKAQNNGNLSTKSINDNQNNTYYHSSWQAGDELHLDSATGNNALIFELAEEKEISAIRYLPRQGENDMNGDRNGRITKYEVWVQPENGSYEMVTSGSWENNQSWKIAQFASTRAKFVKLVAKGTYGAPNSNYYINCAEFRTVETARIERGSLEAANIVVEPTRDGLNPIITVSVAGKSLNRGHDYTATFAAVNENQAKVIVTGINDYSGTREYTFDLAKDVALTSVELIGLPQNAYIGDIIDPSEVSFRLTYSNGVAINAGIKDLGNRLALSSGFNKALGYGFNQLTFTIDGKEEAFEIFALRGDLDKAYMDALARLDVNLELYENVSETQFVDRLNDLKALNREELERGSLMNAISLCEKEFAKLVLKQASFSSVEAKASLALSYNTNTLTATKLKLRFGGRIEAALIDEAKEYGVIVVANNSADSMKLAEGINAEGLAALKAKGLAYDMEPARIDDNTYQFAWVIDNIPFERYGFEFKAFLYEKDSAGNVVLSKEKVASVDNVINTYVADAERLQLPQDVVEVLRKLQK